MGDNFDLGKVLNQPIHGWVDGPGSRPLKMDKKTRALLTEPPRVHAAHEGISFLTSASTLVNTGGKLGVRLATNAIPYGAHMEMEFSGGLSAVFRTWLPSVSEHTPANEPVMLNRYIGHPNASGVSFCHTPTSADTDPPVRKIYLGTAGRGANLGTGGFLEQRELVIPAGVVLYLELESLVDSNSLNIFFNWVEPLICYE